MMSTSGPVSYDYHARIERAHNWIGEYLLEHPHAPRDTVEALALAQGRLSALMTIPGFMLAVMEYESIVDITREIDDAIASLIDHA